MNDGRVKIALAYKVYFIVLISVAFCAVFIGTYNYYDSKDSLSKDLGSELERIARTVALSIDVQELQSIKSATSPAYKKIKDYLLDVKDKNEIDVPIYIYEKADKRTASLLVTTEAGYMLGAIYSSNPTMKYVFETGESNFSPIYTDRSGTWISAYAPLYLHINNEDGPMAGAAKLTHILELNRHVEYYIDELKYKLFKIIMFCALGFLIGTILGIPLLVPILNSIRILNFAALQIEKGNYDYEVKLKTSDEIGHLASTFEAMRKAIKNYIEQLRNAWLSEKKTHLESVMALAEAIAIREPHMKGHVERVSKYAELIAEELELSGDEIETLKYGAILHDVGKIGVDINILNKPTKLSEKEYEKVKEHPFLGAQIVKGVEFLGKAKDAVLYHQEKFDGTGYPEGLKGDEIPILARIVAVVDAYDAMLSKRPYKDKGEIDTIVDKIKSESGKQFDPEVVKAFLKVRDRLK